MADKAPCRWVKLVIGYSPLPQCMHPVVCHLIGGRDAQCHGCPCHEPAESLQQFAQDLAARQEQVSIPITAEQQWDMYDSEPEPAKDTTQKGDGDVQCTPEA